MTVEEVRGNIGGEEDRNYDNFPVGMRVLAVDDDPICLKQLEGLLRKCQYQVTMTSQARMALKMLRENKDRFDLVISDVYMPDMDGLKLLEHVGLEMDLPVIMLSENSDTKLVMKGITHGACDYLVKPVRIEQLRNIWQHVIRRKKFDSRNQSMPGAEDKAIYGDGEDGQGNLQTGNADQNGKSIKKRKDDEDAGEENGHEQEDPTAQKKPRVVWSIELHRKFVASVNQLGIEKAVPRRILDLMNVEGLTRENVASHLQKYRLYLKRISSVATQQPNMVATLGGKDSAYMRMGSVDGLGDFRTLDGSGRFGNPAFSSFTQGGMFGRLNSPACVTLRNLAPSALVQPSHSQSLSNSVSTLGRLHHAFSPAGQNASLLQGVPSTLELDQLQQNKCLPMGDSRIFNAASAFTDTRTAMINSNSSFTVTQSNSMMLRGNSQQSLPSGGFLDQSSVSLAPFIPESFNNVISGSSTFMDDGTSNYNWQNAVQLSKFNSSALPQATSFGQRQLPLTSLRENNSLAGPHLQNTAFDFSSTTAVSAPLEDSRAGIRSQEDLLGGIVQNINHGPHRHVGEAERNYSHNSNNTFSTLNSHVAANGAVNPVIQSLGEDEMNNRRIDLCLTGQSSGGASTFLLHTEINKPAMFSRTRSGGCHILEQSKPQGGLVVQSHDSLDDLMSAVIEREQDGDMFVGDVEFDDWVLI